MKQKLLKMMLLLCALVVGSGTAWGDTTASVTISDYASAQKWTSGTAYSSVTIDTYVSASGKSGGNNNKYYSSNESWRHYEGDGGEITISVTGGNTLKSITFTYANGNSGVLQYNRENWSTGTECTDVDGETSATFTVGHSSGTKNGNVQITAITVKYAAPTTVITPTFTITEGTYNANQSVEINCGTAGATIYYTTDGTDPTTSSSVYSSAISVTQTTTIKALGVKAGLTNSSIASATYTLKCATPTITVPSGPFVSSKEVTITSTDGATIRYTTDGSTTPSKSVGTIYDSEDKPSISATTTIKAIAYKDGWSDSDVQSTTITKETVLDGISALNSATTSTTASAHYVNLTDAQVTWTGTGNIGYLNDASAGIYIYGVSMTLNTQYNGVWKITTKKYNNLPEITAFASVTGEGTSAVVSAMAPTEMTPSDLDDAFTDNLGRQIQITAFEVPDGKALTENIDLYGTTPYTDVTVGNTYTLIGYPFINSTTKTFRITQAIEKPEAPTFSPAAGEFASDFELTISAATGSTIYYTTNGDTPTSSSSLYNPESKPTISAGADVTVKAIAVLAGMTSDVATATYEYKAVSRPTFDPVSGTSVYYGETVELACDVDGSAIYYTTDGTTPDGESSIYSDPIAITSNSVTIKAKAKKGSDWSSEASATFTLKTPDAPTATPGAGAVENGTSVTLSSRAGTTIYYTLDGSAPDNTSAVYSSAITIDAAKTIKAVAYDGAGNKGSVLEAAYTIVKVATPAFATATGTFPISKTVSISCETEGATIYYTTDGSDPTTSSTEYTAPFDVTATTTIKAIAVKSNCIDSEVASVTYTKATVYTVAEVLAQATATTLGNDIYVKGYIVGSYNSTAPKTGADREASNLALADSYNEATGSNTIPVQLSNNSTPRTQFNVVDHPHYMGVAQVIVKADAASYFSTKGLKNTDEIIKIGEKVQVTAAGYATWASDAPLDFTDKNIYAYIAKANGTSGVTFEQVEKVPANTGVLLYYTGAIAEDIPVFNGSGAYDTDGNVFKVGAGAAVASVSGDLHNYILNKPTDKPIGFYRAAGQTVAKNRAYIQIDESTPVKGFIALPGSEETAVEAVKAETEDGVIFNLAGQRVSKLQRGINIVNGRKVVVK